MLCVFEFVGLEEFFPHTIACGSQLVGITATFLAPCIFRQLGVVWGGLCGILVQTLSLAAVVMCFFAWDGQSTCVTLKYYCTALVSPIVEFTDGKVSWVCLCVFSHRQRTYIFLALVVLSRAGLWTFDLAETQLMQCEPSLFLPPH